jgi:hypothetical protein
MLCFIAAHAKEALELTKLQENSKIMDTQKQIKVSGIFCSVLSYLLTNTFVMVIMLFSS